MHNQKTRVRADKFDEYQESMKVYGMEDSNAIPVDLYGKRVWKTKADSNLQEAGEDIKEAYMVIKALAEAKLVTGSNLKEIAAMFKKIADKLIG